MQPSTTTPTPPTCTACLDPIQGPHLLIATHALCHPCFRHLFTLALTDETSYPASWSGNPLSATRYAHILAPSLLAAYRAKEIEYACPVQERVFCSRTDPPRRPEPYGQFVGQWREARVEACVKCERCAWYTCLRCEETFSTGDVAGSLVAILHSCDPTRDLELEERAFRGLRRGREWQLCPNGNCKRRVELSDGCNHMRCICRTHFCFICGDFVKDGQGHWRSEGGCPRFGQKDSKRAIYDDEDVWDDNGDVGDEERAREMQYQEDGEEESLRRAFEVQVAMVDEMRWELEEGERERLERSGEGGYRGEERGRRKHRRRRKREGQDLGDEQRERHVVRRRRDEHQPQGPNERGRQRLKGFRAFINEAIDVTEHALFGKGAARRG